MTSTDRRLSSYGPVQFPARLGIPLWQFQRALDDGLIPPADPVTGRWPTAVVERAVAGLERIQTATGTQPDVGADRAARVLADRFGIEVESGILLELDRRGLIRVIGDYQGWPLYDGRALERFTDQAALEAAIRVGRLLTRDQAAAHLGVRRVDVDALIQAGWVTPATCVHSSWQSRRDTPRVPLVRIGDLDHLAADPAIDWETVRATPAGRPSVLAALDPRST